MQTRFAPILLIVITGSISTAGPVAAQSPAQSFEFRQPRFKNACPPPLKFAAGACVRRCPAGYRNNGGYCRLQGGGW